MYVLVSLGNVPVKLIPTQNIASGLIHLYYVYCLNNSYILVHKDHFHYLFLLHSITHFVCSLWTICTVCIFVAKKKKLSAQLFSLLPTLFVFVVYTPIENIFLWKKKSLLLMCFVIILSEPVFRNLTFHHWATGGCWT